MGVRRLDGGSSASSDPDDVTRRLEPENRFPVRPEPHEAAADGAVGGPPANAQDIEQLLASLSLLRLAMSAELSAAAGALEDQRPDVAADLVGGARSDLQQLRAGVARRQARELAPALVGAGRKADSAPGALPQTDDAAPLTLAVPHPRRSVGLGNWQGRILAGALAVALALMVLPHSGSGGNPARPSAAKAQSQAFDVKLVSSEFSTLLESLQSPTPAAASVLAAGRNWHTAVARSLPDAATHATTATQIVELLREERALLATPAMNTPAMRETATTLASSADSLLARLRALASSQVLAVLPAALAALPLPLTPTPAKTTEAPGTKSGPAPASTQDANPVTPAAPQPTFSAPGATAPTTAPSGPSLPIPLPNPPLLPNLPTLPDIISHLGGLKSSQDTTSSPIQSGADSLSASVQNALKALSLGS